MSPIIQGFFRIGVGFFGSYAVYRSAIRPNAAVNIGGQNDLNVPSNVINLQGPWVFGKGFGRSRDGASFARMLWEGGRYQVYNARSLKLPYADDSVPTVYTNSVPINQGSGMYPPIKSSEIERILKPGGQWIRDGHVYYTKPGG